MRQGYQPKSTGQPLGNPPQTTTGVVPPQAKTPPCWACEAWYANGGDCRDEGGAEGCDHFEGKRETLAQPEKRQHLFTQLVEERARVAELRRSQDMLIRHLGNFVHQHEADQGTLRNERALRALADQALETTRLMVIAEREAREALAIAVLRVFPEWTSTPERREDYHDAIAALRTLTVLFLAKE